MVRSQKGNPKGWSADLGRKTPQRTVGSDDLKTTDRRGQVNVTERSDLGRLTAAAGAVMVAMAGVAMGVTLVVAPASTIMFAPAASFGVARPVERSDRPSAQREAAVCRS